MDWRDPFVTVHEAKRGVRIIPVAPSASLPPKRDVLAESSASHRSMTIQDRRNPRDDLQQSLSITGSEAATRLEKISPRVSRDGQLLFFHLQQMTVAAVIKYDATVFRIMS